MIFTIDRKPVGINLPLSALQVIQGLVVRAYEEDDKIIVPKALIVEEVKKINKQWAALWDNCSSQKIEFSKIKSN